MHGKQVIEEIEALVRRYGVGRYRMWLIGTASDEESAKRRTGVLHHCWKVDGEMTAANIQRYFIEKGMVPDVAYGEAITDCCVYVR